LREEVLSLEFARHPGKQVVAGCEAMDNAFWVHDRLAEMGIELRIAPPYQLKVIFQTCYKNDRLDARKMAQLLAKDLFPAVWVPPVELRDLRELLRLRVQMVRERGRWVCRYHALLRRWGRKSTHRGAAVLRDGEGVLRGLRPATQRAAQELLMAVAFSDARVRELDREIQRRLREVPEMWEEVKLLMTVPAVGIGTASTLVLEIGRIDRFPTERQFHRYCRLTPGVKQSGRRSRNLQLAKDARRELCWLLVEAAWQAVRLGSYHGVQYRRRVAAGMKPSRAIIPVARSLASTLYRVWKSRTPYPALFAQKSAA
jgi:transposase